MNMRQSVHLRLLLQANELIYLFIENDEKGEQI